jgi:hypothetical protein
MVKVCRLSFLILVYHNVMKREELVVKVTSNKGIRGKKQSSSIVRISVVP